MGQQAITLAFSTTSSFSGSFPQQRQYFLDTTNPLYVRNATLTQDALYLTYFTNSVVIPLSNLYSIAATVQNTLSWPPIIVTQPNSASVVTHPSSSWFNITASSQLSPLTYQWFSQSYSQSLTSSTAFYQLTSSATYTGSNTAFLYYPTSSIVDNSASYLCVVTNPRGSVTSSISTLYVY